MYNEQLRIIHIIGFIVILDSHCLVSPLRWQIYDLDSLEIFGTASLHVVPLEEKIVWVNYDFDLVHIFFTIFSFSDNVD